jgi:TonB family protein
MKLLISSLEEPVFPGGDEAMQKFIKDNLVYPAEDKEKGEQGKVYVRFVVEADGTITNVVIARGVSPSIDAEALRIVKMMPSWMPGKQRGRPVVT